MTMPPPEESRFGFVAVLGAPNAGKSTLINRMATSIPPHNVAEICNGLLHLIKFPKATVAKLVDLIPGPDFPTGGVLCENRDAIVEAYKTGRGSFRVRASYEVEKIKGGGYRVIVTGMAIVVAVAIQPLRPRFDTERQPARRFRRSDIVEPLKLVAGDARLRALAVVGFTYSGAQVTVMNCPLQGLAAVVRVSSDSATRAESGL